MQCFAIAIAAVPAADARMGCCFAAAPHVQCRFALLPPLSQTACTGVVRYPWKLLRPLVWHTLETRLREFEAAEAVDIGPARPLLPDASSVDELLHRLSALLDGFSAPPWTMQRLCELLLEPRKQYSRLHKLTLALERLLLVTGELPRERAPPPPPLLPLAELLARVNEPPPRPLAEDAASGPAGDGVAVGQKRPRPDEPDTGGLAAAALTITQQVPGQAAAAAAAATATAVAQQDVSMPEPAPDASAAILGCAVDDDGEGGGGASTSTTPAAAAGKSAVPAPQGQQQQQQQADVLLSGGDRQLAGGSAGCPPSAGQGGSSGGVSTALGSAAAVAGSSA